MSSIADWLNATLYDPPAAGAYGGNAGSLDWTSGAVIVCLSVMFSMKARPRTTAEKVTYWGLLPALPPAARLIQHASVIQAALVWLGALVVAAFLAATVGVLAASLPDTPEPVSEPDPAPAPLPVDDPYSEPVTLSVYLNEAAPQSFSRGYRPGDSLRQVVELPISAPNREPRLELAVTAFYDLNDPASPLEWVQEYRAAGNRNFGVGDVITVGEDAWAFTGSGWTPIDKAHIAKRWSVRPEPS